MTEQEIREIYNKIMFKAGKLEFENPYDSRIHFAVGVAVGATISMISSVGYSVNVSDDNKRFFASHKINIFLDYTGFKRVGSANIGYVSLEYAYNRLKDIERALDRVDDLLKLEEDLNEEFTKNGWGKNWEQK